MKKVYEEPKYIVWQLETENLEALTSSTPDVNVGAGDIMGDPLDNQGPTY